MAESFGNDGVMELCSFISLRFYVYICVFMRWRVAARAWPQTRSENEWLRLPIMLSPFCSSSFVWKMCVLSVRCSRHSATS